MPRRPSRPRTPKRKPGRLIAEISGSKAKGYRFKIVGRNGEPVAPRSEYYTRRDSARRGAQRLSPGCEIRFV